MNEVTRGLSESEQLNLSGGVDDHDVARQSLDLIEHVLGLRCHKVSGKNLGTVGAQIVLVHYLG